MNYSNQFLIAMPSLLEAQFYHSVILVVEHNANGAMGVIINQPTDLTFTKIIEHFNIKPEDENNPLFDQQILRGGPLKKEHGFILHQGRGDWRATVPVGEDLGLTASRDIINAMVESKGPEQALIILGCAGWVSGQLEEEIRDNTWLTVPADPKIIFDCPYHERWQKAAHLIGVDVERLCEAGHA
ncbi:MAG TPA: YqgE/AlgH family protein [Gammaproteobacteria bacterium]|nr:YqgE/AlgH family protein [Gammaproteobacteria bacterium]